MGRLKLGILISGRGSNMQALVERFADTNGPAEVATVISNRPEAAGLAHAEAAGLPTRVIDHRDYGDRAAFDRELDAALSSAGVELVCLAGFMRLLTPDFVNKWQERVVNIHPSLLPAFKGLNVHNRVIASGVRITGATVHIVRPEMDDGPILAQAAVPVAQDDTEDTLAARVLAVEHRIYPLAVSLIAEGRVRIVGDRVQIDGAAAVGGALLNPEAG